MTYVVQRNDTPASIAAKFGRPGQAAALVQVNPQKARQVVHGVTTFRSLNIGEVLNLPVGWGVGVGFTTVRPNPEPPTRIVPAQGPPSLSWKWIGSVSNGIYIPRIGVTPQPTIIGSGSLVSGIQVD